VPHVHDSKTHDELLALSGADTMIHPVVAASEDALRDILDQIASADFVLTASLHAAIIACAYGRPFAFWDNGHIDIPFKWQDFAGSIGIPTTFVKNLAEGRRLYEHTLAPLIKVPPLAAILDVCPFSVRPSVLLKALAFDQQADSTAISGAVALLEQMPAYRASEIYRLQDRSAASRNERKRIKRSVVGGLGLSARDLKNRARRLLRV
jgi:hypothetical protein